MSTPDRQIHSKCCDCVDESAGTQFRVLNRLRARESEAAGAGKEVA